MTSRMSFRIALVVLCPIAAYPIPASAGQKPWIEVRSPHFRVLTDGSASDARKVAFEFEQLRFAFATRFPNARLESGAPLLIFAARDAETAKQLNPSFWNSAKGRLAGYFQSGWEKQFAVVRLDTFGGNGSKEVVYHEYAHTILHLNSHWLPMWLDEGLAEYYAYTRFQEHKIFLGAPTIRIKIFGSRMPDPVEKILSITRSSPESLSEYFYAESWALVHFLIYGPEMEGGKKFAQFYDLIQERVEQKQAFQQVFGDIAKLDVQLAAYMQRNVYSAIALRADPQIDEKSFVTRELSVAQTEAELGDYHVRSRDTATGRAMTEQAVKDDPKLGLPHEDMGFLDSAEGRDAEAAREFAEASTMNGDLYLSLFYGTMLSPLAASNAEGDRSAFGARLLRVVKLNPNFAPAYVQMARLALREDDLSSALTFSQKAEDLAPSLASYHLMTGQILHRLGKDSDAAATAKFVADRWTGADHDEAVELWNSIPPGHRPAGDSPTEIRPPDTQSAEGEIKSVSCSDQGKNWILVISRVGQSLTFHQNGSFGVGFSDTLWYGGDHFTPCHHMEGLRAVVRYHPAADSTYDGNVVGIEIRNDLPKPLKPASSSSRQ